MTESAIRPVTQPGLRPALYMANVIAPKYRRIMFEEVFLAVKRLNPGIQIGTWGLPNVSDPPADDPGIEMLSIDGVRLGVLVIDAPAPPEIFQIGGLANIFMDDPAKVCAGHRCHITVTSPRTPKHSFEALEIARAVTLAARALAEVTQALAIKWVDADHIAPPTVFDSELQKLALPEGIAPLLWVRLLAHRGPPTPQGEATLIVGTVGLHAFGQRDLEYAPSTKPMEYLFSHAIATAEYMLNPYAVVRDGDTMGPEGHVYTMAFRPRGLFLDTPISLLTPKP